MTRCGCATTLPGMTLRLALAAAAVAAGIAAPSAGAACYGAAGTLVACTRTVEVHRVCVYTGPTTCTWYVVKAPLCVYGTIGSGGYFVTAWC